MPRLSAAEAGRRGGSSRSAKKLAACRKNGFQPVSETEQRQRDVDVEQWLADAKILGLPQNLIDGIAGMKASGVIADVVSPISGLTIIHPINAVTAVAKRNILFAEKAGE